MGLPGGRSVVPAVLTRRGVEEMEAENFVKTARALQKWSVKTGQAFRCKIAVVYAAFVSGFRL